MIGRRQFLAQAGSILSLPFLWRALEGRAEEVRPPTGPARTFQPFASNCIDLGHYDQKKRELTVRFVNKKTERFYRYSNVPSAVWTKMRKLNESGGVGRYFTETIVHHPKNYPFEELTIRDFKVTPAKKPSSTNSPPTFKPLSDK